MYRISLFLLLIFSLPAQKEIHIIFYGNTKLSHFELDLIKDLLLIHSQITNKKFVIKYRGIREIKKRFSALNEYEKDSALMINGITVTEERQKKYDFSIPYIVNKYSLLSRKDYFLRVDNKPVIIGIISGSIQEKMTDHLIPLFPFKTMLFENRIEAIKKLNSREVDMIFGDFIAAWDFDLKLVRHVNEEQTNELAIMYKKGSNLKSDLDIAFKKYKTTNLYSDLLKKHFGDDRNLFFYLTK